jgi:hypothetical protein
MLHNIVMIIGCSAILLWCIYELVDIIKRGRNGKRDSKAFFLADRRAELRVYKEVKNDDI